MLEWSLWPLESDEVAYAASPKTLSFSLSKSAKDGADK